MFVVFVVLSWCNVVVLKCCCGDVCRCVVLSLRGFGTLLSCCGVVMLRGCDVSFCCATVLL